ncbi:hypothetical protein AGMMS49959_15070 [Planctomycetales bacterium]|nr:hypothetical protein AGMMS49959_15070 [Planctomycetales bacterium]
MFSNIDILRTIVLLRHARSNKNDQNRHGGKGSTLVDGATIEIESVVDQLSQIPTEFELILYSPRIQCEQTANVLGKLLKIPVIKSQELDPIYLGVIDGMSDVEVTNTYPEISMQLEKWRNGEIEINQLKIPKMANCHDFYDKGKVFIENIINSKKFVIIVATRSVLVLLMNVLLDRSSKVGGNYREIKWKNSEFAIFNNNGIGKYFNSDISTLRLNVVEVQHTIRGTLGNLRGVIHNSIFPAKGIVILVHGYFTSNKLGPENLYVQIARLFATCGYDVWRFDSYGVGDSDGSFDDSTYGLRINDYKIIIDIALKQHNNILLLGHSMGTSISIYLANTYHQNIKTLFLLSPSFGGFTWIDNLIPKETQELLQQHGFAYRRTQRITNNFIEQIVSENIYQEVLKCNARCILFYGLNDEYFDKLSVSRVTEHMKHKTLIEISGNGHNFLGDRMILFEKIKFAIMGL